MGERLDISQRELAEKVGITLMALNYSLKALMGKGFVKLKNFQNSKHKYKCGYILTPSGVAEKVSMTGRFFKRKLQECGASRAEVDAFKVEVTDSDSINLSPRILMSSNQPKISIITATWNCKNTLPDCLASVARQDYAHREHIVVDGASTDGTIDVVRQHIDQIAIFKSERDEGIYDALNKGINLATGEVVGFLHADDLYASDEVLSKVGEAFADSSVCAVYGDLEYVKHQDTTKVVRRWQSHPFKKQDLSWGWMPAHPTLYVRKEWYSRIGGFDITYRIAADYLSVLHLFTQPEFRAVYLPNVLVKMRLGGVSNRSLRAIASKSKEDWRALRSYGFSWPTAMRAIAWKNLSKLTQFT